MKFNFQKTALLNQSALNQTALKLNDYLQELKKVSKSNTYSVAEASINLPFDDRLLQQVQKVSKSKVTKKLKAILVIGIGGSNLGTKAVYDAIKGNFDLLENDRLPKLIFVDTNSPQFLKKLTEWLKKNIKSLDQILITIISKSGTTTETIANYEVIFTALAKLFTPIRLRTRVVTITDENSQLWHESIQQKITLLPIPKIIGGRYSVFSAVGLFPLLCAGIDIKKMRLGAQQMQQQCLNKDLNSNPALASATIQYLQYQAQKRINDNFFFVPELESLGKWYRQLIAESIGKNEQIGITPTISIGSTDLHSVGQLYLGGPKDKMATFIYALAQNNITVPQVQQFPNLVEGLKKLPIEKLLAAIYEGTKMAYKNRNLPFMEIELEEINEFELGQFLQFKMIEIMFLAKLFEVNAFDQPNVEAYKIETRKILKQK